MKVSLIIFLVLLIGVSATTSIPNCPYNYRLNANWPETSPGSIATGFCTVGFDGAPTRVCGPNGVWSPSVNNPCYKVCLSILQKGAYFPQTINSNTATGICQPGLVGSVSRYCSSTGSWSEISGLCTVLKCPADTSGTGNANWIATNHGVTTNGVCLPGYYGTATRLCKEDGTWDVVTTSCFLGCRSEINFSASWAITPAGTSAEGTCTYGTKGFPTRYCQADGTWTALTSGSCEPYLCPPTGSYSHTSFPDGGIAGQWVTGVCDRGYTGVGTRFCGPTGEWTSNFQSRCVISQCKAEFNIVSWPLAVFDQFINRGCPGGVRGSVSRICGVDGNWGPITNTCPH